MENIHIDPTPRDRGIRLDIYLTEYFIGKYSRTYLQRLISGGHVLINAKPCTPNHKISAGDKIDIIFPQPEESHMKPQDIAFEIIYQDKDLLVVNKPAGMITHPGAGVKDNTLVNALLYCCKDLSGIGGKLRPGIVHRLDKDTSGIMLVAKNDYTHRELAKQFKRRQIERKYAALVEGKVEFDSDQINLPIGKDIKNREKMAIKYADSKEAITTYKVIKRFADSTLLEIEPITGRTHQIRVHMKAIGHPIVGDTKYGTGRPCTSRVAPVQGRQMLHAKWIKFFHPVLKKYMEFSSQAPF